MTRSRYRILVVDDEELVRSLLSRFLRGRGCEVRLAATAEEAICEATEFRPDAAIVDLVLPGRDGLELLHGLRRDLPDCEVLIISGTADVDRVARAVQSGASAFVPKPFGSFERLWSALQRALEQRAVRLRTREIAEGRTRRNRERVRALEIEPQEIDLLRDLDDTFDAFLDVVVRELDVERASVMLFDPSTSALRIVASRGDYPVDTKDVRVPLGQGVAGVVAETGRARLVDGSDAEGGGAASGWAGVSDSFVSVPLSFDAASRDVVGALNVTNRRTGRPFDSDDRAFLSGLAAQLGAAVGGAIESSRLESAYEALKAAQDRLVFSERVKAIGEMAAGVAHDFNNVLGVILARVESAIARVEKGELDAATSDLRLVVHSALQGAGAIKRIQDYTEQRGDTGHVSVDLNATVRDAIELARPKWSGCRIDVRADLGRIPPVHGSRYELMQALGNLIFNAVEATPTAGTIVLTTSHGDDGVALRCTDDGVGMDEATRRRLFEPFFTTKRTGHGLGMGIVREITERHRGTIDVESAPGQGTSFTLRFPAAEPDPPAVEPPRLADGYRPEACLKVLFVDDDTVVRDTYAEALGVAGHTVRTAADATSALARFTSETFDVLISDVNLGGMSGLDLAQEVRRLSPEQPVLLFTGGEPERIAAGAREAGVAAVIAKPCRLDDLLRALDDAVRNQPAPVA